MSSVLTCLLAALLGMMPVLYLYWRKSVDLTEARYRCQEFDDISRTKNAELKNAWEGQRVLQAELDRTKQSLAQWVNENRLLDVKVEQLERSLAEMSEQHEEQLTRREQLADHLERSLAEANRQLEETLAECQRLQARVDTESRDRESQRQETLAWKKREQEMETLVQELQQERAEQGRHLVALQEELTRMGRVLANARAELERLQRCREGTRQTILDAVACSFYLREWFGPAGAAAIKTYASLDERGKQPFQAKAKLRVLGVDSADNGKGAHESHSAPA